MSDSRAATRYAKAVLDFAMEQKAADKVEKDMKDIIATIAESNELKQVLSSPVVKSEIKKASLKAIFKDGGQITMGLLDTLMANKRLDLLNEVALKYIAQYEQRKGEDVAYVTSAVPLTKALEDKILAQVASLTGKKVTLENKVDEALVGGFVLRVGDLQYDASVASKLKSLKREFTNSL
ncbi:MULTISPECIES: ATP synthase F1 subunit delta [Flavobacteriaceae]|uniref:ATP synthase subunit delta n=1 Tax=Croceivirga radicis TaxID=1929488 RepID=A0A1V6LVS0_9FLAO|nr:MULTISPECIES: ATP synthase F1 subunit delta [Flavobacteriaceae]NJB37109.1 ATP synthase F1 subunit delta [Croceivirga sp. JEA036]OQD44218.1 ATP synthase F1 subunit delta [Croceivirga radicis]TKD65065.1 ATP synthase F1 subunit delta [Flavobacterium sp. ASW18X]